MSKLIVRAPTMAEMIAIPPGAYDVANTLLWDVGNRNKKIREDPR